MRTPIGIAIAVASATRTIVPRKAFAMPPPTPTIEGFLIRKSRLSWLAPWMRTE